jgi:hypothetical protein
VVGIGSVFALRSLLGVSMSGYVWDIIWVLMLELSLVLGVISG